jgi:hypothetical protein
VISDLCACANAPLYYWIYWTKKLLFFNEIYMWLNLYKLLKCK